jgi:histone H3
MRAEAMNPTGYNTRNMSPVQLARLGRDRKGACPDGVSRFLGGPCSSPNSVLELHRFYEENVIGWETHKHWRGITTRIALYKGEEEHVGKMYDHSTGSLPSPRKTTPKKRKFCPTRPAMRSNPLGGNRRPGPHRFRPGTVALQEIRRYQGRRRDSYQYEKKELFGKDATRLLIPKAAFQRLVKEITQAIKSDCRITVQAMTALQTAAEDHLIGIFQDSNLLAFHRERTTVNPDDIRTALRIRREPESKLTVNDRSHDSLNYVFPTRTDGVAQRFGW